MKTIIIATIILLPCLAVLNDSGTIIPNVFGIIYILVLKILSYSEKGKRFVRKFWKETEKVENVFFK